MQKVLTICILTGVCLWSAATTLGQSGSTQRMFSAPQEAVDALLDAFKADDEAALLDILGQQHRKLVVVTDKIERQRNLSQLYAFAQEAQKLEADGPNKRTLVIGNADWPFPIPLVKEGDKWRFDTDAGAEEIINRRVGRNELQAIEVCRAYVGAQELYASADRDEDEVLEYAQKLGSDSGKRNGLYWEVDAKSDEPLSPLGPLLAESGDYLEHAKTSGKGRLPYLGYFYKILTKQGSHPPGGAYDYVINQNMIAGFALLAWPADYGSSGVMTFVVSHQGKVYEKDLGDSTPSQAVKIGEYDPDEGWKMVQAE